MRVLSDQPGSDGYSDNDGEEESIKESSEWRVDRSTLDIYLKNKEADLKLIRLANQQFKLIDILRNLNIPLEEKFSDSGWKYKACCPLPNHEDSTASFGCNVIKNIFNCFGCHRGGGPVQFLAYVQKKAPIIVAKELLKANENIYDIIAELEENEQSKIEEILLDFSDHVRQYLSQQEDTVKALKLVESVTWNLDVYLQMTVPNGSVDVDSLTARIDILKRYLENKNG